MAHEGHGTPERRKPGPLPGPSMRLYSMRLDPADADWGKRQPDGLSGLVRRLLKQERQRQERRNRDEQHSDG